MKKIIVVFLFCLTLAFSSCAENHSKDVYFVHAVAFTCDEAENFNIIAAMEKQSSEEEKYFVDEQSGSNIEDAVNKFKKKYNEIYFAANEVYIVPKLTDALFLKELISVLENSDLPLSSEIICCDEKKLRNVAEYIESEDSLKELIDLSGKDKVNIVHWLACCYSNLKNAKIPYIEINGEGEIKKVGTCNPFDGNN